VTFALTWHPSHEPAPAAFLTDRSTHVARAALKAAPGITVIDHRADEGYVTPVEAAGDGAGCGAEAGVLHGGGLRYESYLDH